MLRLLIIGIALVIILRMVSRPPPLTTSLSMSDAHKERATSRFGDVG